MDGNGRWARHRSWKRVRGHRKGVDTVRSITEACSQLNIKQLTLYALSTENFQNRPAIEIRFLMNLLKTFVLQEQETMMKNNIQLITIGHPEDFPEDVRQAIEASRHLTAENTGMKLCLALNYGGRREILDAVRKVAENVKSGNLDLKDIDENTFSNCLYQKNMPELDLLIRTAGEMRISNFLLWQLSYAEIWVSEKLWPEFTPEDLYQAIEDFSRRERRYGGLKNLNQVSN
jgi:undecaprenyl diphosphate synthase